MKYNSLQTAYKEEAMQCHYCRKDLGAVHKNRKYCGNSCENKARYARTGQRSTAEQRSKWYWNRCQQDGYKEKLRSQGNERYRRIQAFLREYKLSKGCTDCGYNAHHEALEFDHVNGGKEINVCFSKSVPQAKKEILKCEVVCANCHAVRTFRRLQK
jgi:hypothetical protein